MCRALEAEAHEIQRVSVHLTLQSVLADFRVWALRISQARQVEPGEKLPSFLLFYAGKHREAGLSPQPGFRGDPVSRQILDFLRAQGMTDQYQGALLRVQTPW